MNTCHNKNRTRFFIGNKQKTQDTLGNAIVPRWRDPMLQNYGDHKIRPPEVNLLISLIHRRVTNQEVKVVFTM